MDLSIIIVNYNTRDLLDRCLSSIYESLKGRSLQFEIIVIDNASDDDSIDLLNNKYTRVVKILNKKNSGFGKGNNQGIKKARGNYVLLLNTDIKALGDAIEKLYNFARGHKKSFTGGKLYNEDLSPQPSCGPMYSLPIVFFMLFLQGDRLGITRYSPNRIKAVDWVSGACLIAEKNNFLRVGLFDEKIFMYMEEIDFLYRAKKDGYYVFFYPDGHFIHTGAASSASSRSPVMNIYKGLLYFYHKHRSIIEEKVLRFFLFVKAYGVLVFAKITGNRQLISIYEQALGVV